MFRFVGETALTHDAPATGHHVRQQQHNNEQLHRHAVALRQRVDQRTQPVGPEKFQRAQHEHHRPLLRGHETGDGGDGENHDDVQDQPTANIAPRDLPRTHHHRTLLIVTGAERQENVRDPQHHDKGGERIEGSLLKVLWVQVRQEDGHGHAHEKSHRRDDEIPHQSVKGVGMQDEGCRTTGHRSGRKRITNALDAIRLETQSVGDPLAGQGGREGGVLLVPVLVDGKVQTSAVGDAVGGMRPRIPSDCAESWTHDPILSDVGCRWDGLLAFVAHAAGTLPAIRRWTTSIREGVVAHGGARNAAVPVRLGCLRLCVDILHRPGAQPSALWGIRMRIPADLLSYQWMLERDTGTSPRLRSHQHGSRTNFRIQHLIVTAAVAGRLVTVTSWRHMF
mmetsp:Transcript_44267/g.117352  ORF Transcript_44267/g.117352 Transcript_44267/m.117352 type:complete len:393 (-) Transcript_44267:358-1536(-)